ncbi:hypothetical protein, partial [Klebsiella oxytoca]
NRRDEYYDLSNVNFRFKIECYITPVTRNSSQKYTHSADMQYKAPANAQLKGFTLFKAAPSPIRKRKHQLFK